MMGIEVLLLIPFTLNYKLFNKVQRLIYLYAIYSAVLSIGAEALARIFRHNLAWHAVMYLVSYYLLSVFYLKVIQKPLTRKIILWMVPVVTALFIADFVWISGPRGFSSIFVSFRTFLLIIYGILFFVQLVRDGSLSNAPFISPPSPNSGSTPVFSFINAVTSSSTCLSTSCWPTSPARKSLIFSGSRRAWDGSPALFR